ncbi:ATP-binding protein [Arenibaculum pallidiluteum]|uniref:ATP-binding protein n=1 Tax=Arenibaculum pallidiluteum TaxID=2812559 RepID=UPI001A96E1A3|nr:ATP-binding protein [Arenibaculum pallidiluteum]
MDAPDADLTACDREPIHIPGTIQPHGVLLAFDGPQPVLTRASANLGTILTGTDRIPFGRGLDEVLDGDRWRPMRDTLARLRRQSLDRPHHLGLVNLRNAEYQAIAHRTGETLVLELERMPPLAIPAEEIYGLVRDGAERLQAAKGIDALCAQAAVEFRRLTGFDRVLVYRFDESWHGKVVAEDRNERLPSYLDLRFPASDIPQQARELYRLNRIRLIPDATYDPVPILVDGEGRGPLDLSFAVLRSVSPVHLEYMRNMGTPASMSVSVVVEGRLWALISCHHAEPLRVPFAVRLACDFLGQMLATHLAAQIHASQAATRTRLQAVQARLLTEMAAADPFIEGLVQVPDDLLRLTGSQGAAVVEGGHCRLIGKTPGEAAVLAITARLATAEDEIFHTDHMAGTFPEAESWRAEAAGLLAIRISKLHASFVLWFRPEVIETVRWGGDPHKRVQGDSTARVHPRKSFETWKEIVHLRSAPWRDAEIEAAETLRNAIVGIVLRKAEELAMLTEELERSNKELEAFSYSVSHDLRAPFRHIVGYTELLKEHEATKLSDKGRRYIDVILDSARSAGLLVDSLLGFSRMGRAQLARIEVPMRSLVDDAIRTLEPDTVGRDIRWEFGPLPSVTCDPNMLRLAWQNLLSNAIKYTRNREPAMIEVGAFPQGQEHVFFVRDNGVGFDMAYAGKLFGVFQRLHRSEDFEGIGIGLANVRRIAERHGGRSWAEGAPDQGATFYFSLPASSVQG